MTQEPDLLKMLAVAENAGEAWADGEHIDIFTPTRVRLLIERVVRAEQNFDEADSAKINAEGREENALARAEKAEQAVARVRAMADEMGEGKAFGILTRGREDEYPISYFIEMLEDALDGEPNE